MRPFLTALGEREEVGGASVRNTRSTEVASELSSSRPLLATLHSIIVDNCCRCTRGDNPVGGGGFGVIVKGESSDCRSCTIRRRKLPGK